MLEGSLLELGPALFVAVRHLRVRTSMALFNGRTLRRFFEDFAQPVLTPSYRKIPAQVCFYELDCYIRGAHQSPFTNQVFSNCQPGRLEIVVTRRKQTGGAPLQSPTFTHFGVSRPLGTITRSRGLQVTNYYSRIRTHSFAAICSLVESDIMNLQLWPES